MTSAAPTGSIASRRWSMSRPGRDPRRLTYRVALALCSGLALGLIVTFAIMLRTGNVGVKQVDYVAYYAAAHLVLAGHGSDIYSFAAVGRYERALVYPLAVSNGVLPYVYPPYFALALAPAAMLSYVASYLSWLLLNTVLFILALALLQRYASLTRDGALLLWVAAVAFLPLLAALTQGQTSFLILALLAGVFFAARTGRDWLTGVLLALALIKPPIVLPFLLLFLVRRRWGVVAGFAATGLCLALVPALLFGPGIDRGYLDTLSAAMSWRAQFGYGPEWNHSFAGLAQLLLSSPA